MPIATPAETAYSRRIMTESATSFALATHAGRIILENGGETH